MNSERAEKQFQWRQWLAALAASSTFLNDNSLDNVWMNRRKGEQTILVIGIHTILVIVGAILRAGFADNFGRKNTSLIMLIFLIPRTLHLVMGGSDSFGIDSFLLDVDSGITCTLVPLYISEIASDTNRGSLMVMQLVAALTGVLTIGTSIIDQGFHHYFHENVVLGITVLFVSVIFYAITLGVSPETPQYLNWKKMYHEAARSLDFFSGTEDVRVDEDVTSNLPASVNITDTAQGWTNKIREVFGDQNRRSLAMIFLLIVMKWASGMPRNERLIYTMLKSVLPQDLYAELFYFAITITFSISLMLTIDIFERKLSLLLVIFASFGAINIGITISEDYGPVYFVVCFVRYFAHLICLGVTLSYVGKFFAINVRATAIALVISFEVLSRNTIFGVEWMLGGSWTKDHLYLEHICIAGGAHVAAFFLILIFFPKNT